MSERILIQFKATGDNRLRASMLKLAAAQGLLEKNTKEMRRALTRLTKTFEQTRKGSRLLNNSFATLRSKMLLFSFAMSMGGRQLTQFAKQAAELKGMETAFNTLQGGSENATVAMDKLRGATNKTMSNFDLFQQANNAMVLGITKNSDEMAEMFDMAQRLGNALGKDTKHSVESLITGIGRQSRLMLDNIGIIVDSEKAYKKYAKELKKNASQLTDAEKKQAFLNATLEAARQKLKGIGPEVMGPVHSLQQLSAAWDNFSARLGNVALEILEPLARAFAAILDVFDEERIKSYATALATAALAWGIWIMWQNRATAATNNFRKSLARTGVFAILNIALGELINWMGIYEEETEVATESTNKYIDALAGVPNKIESLTAQQQIYIGQLAEIRSGADNLFDMDFVKKYKDLAEMEWWGPDKMTKRLRQTEESIQAQKDFKNAYAKQMLSRIGLDDESLALNNAIVEIERRILQLEMQKKAQKEALLPNLKNEIALLELKTLFSGAELEKKEALMKAEQEGLDLNFVEQGQLENLIELKHILLAEIQEEIDLKKKQERIEKGLQNSISDALTSGMNDHGRYAKSFGDMLNEMKKQMLANAAVFAITSALSSVFPALSFLKPTGGFLENVFDIFHQGGQVQGYNTGGLIPQYHSGGNVDNVPIMAQEGEFVMRRSAVDSIGLENLNRMNRTGQASGGANITFTGNIMSDSFIEEEAIPKIKDALRRGADLGIS